MSDSKRPLPERVGRYSVVRQLGAGAMGRVLLALDPVLERHVAVKHLRDDLSLEPEQHRLLVERMRQEARASARVSHPNIVALHDMGEDDALGLFLVFEHVEGPTLKERLTRGPLGPVATAKLARELGGALCTAHEAGVLHRDIKPENVMLAGTGGKIADFGIARVPDSTLTKNGGLLGTPAYSAPESISGERFSPASDQFSLACTLYETLSGRRAFPGDDALSVASKIAHEDPPAIAAVCGVDTHVDTVFARALSKNESARFADCDAFGRALAEALELAPRSMMPTLPDDRHRAAEQHGTPSNPQRFAVGGAAIGVLLTIAGFRLTEQLRERERAPAAAPAPTVAVAPATTRSNAPATTSSGELHPVAYLMERPRTKPRTRSHTPTPSNSTDSPPVLGTRDGAISDAGQAEPTPDAAASEASDAAPPRAP